MSDNARDQAIAQYQSIVELVAALECDYERLEELREQRARRFVAGWNMPGYVPDSEPAEFDDLDNAHEYVADAIDADADILSEQLDEQRKNQTLDTLDSEYFNERDKIEAMREAASRARNNLTQEFGETIGRFHYWITRDGSMGLDADETEELEELENAAGETESEDQARDDIEQDALSVEIRSGWQSPDETLEAAEFCILLCTGGPAVRVRGELDEYREPSRAWIEYQDWGTPWTMLHDECIDTGTLLTYCQCFYFGE